MAAIMKVRDENGDVIDIPAIVGPPGADYVLTESDKAEIAELAAELVESSDSSQNPAGGGLSTTAANLLIEILESAVYIANMTGKIASLKEALVSGGNSGGGDTPGEPNEPVVTDDITVADGAMTIVSVGSEITVSGGVMAIA